MRKLKRKTPKIILNFKFPKHLVVPELINFEDLFQNKKTKKKSK